MERTSVVAMQVVCNPTEVDKGTPQKLVFQRSVEPAVDGPLPQAGTELVPRNLPR